MSGRTNYAAEAALIGGTRGNIERFVMVQLSDRSGWSTVHALRVRRSEGGIETSGTFVNDLTVCISMPARG